MEVMVEMEEVVLKVCMEWMAWMQQNILMALMVALVAVEVMVDAAPVDQMVELEDSSKL